MVPVPNAKKESALALGIYIQSHGNNPELKKYLEALQAAQDNDPRIRTIIRSRPQGEIPDPVVRSFYAQIQAKIAGMPAHNPSVAYYNYNQKDQSYHRQVSKRGSTSHWLAIRISDNREKQCYNYDLLIPRVI